MSYKKIVVSDNGKLKEIDTSISDTSISSSLQISVNTASLGLSNGLIKVENQLLSSITGSAQNQLLKFSGSQYILEDTNGLSVIKVGGDLKYENNKVIVNNISNVISGTLSASYGGTQNSSLSGSSASGSLVITNNSTLKASIGNQLLLKNKNSSTTTSGAKSYLENNLLVKPIVYLYTGNVGSPGNYTWTKPQGCRMVRVICQGGGGGGSKAGTTRIYAVGGGGGGYSTLFFGADGLPSTVSIVAGAGGAGGTGASNTANGVNGNNGGTSSFGSYLSATGGAGGISGTSFGTPTTGVVRSAGGSGYNASGGQGSFYNTSTGAAQANKVDSLSTVSLGGAGGGGGAGGFSGGDSYVNARPGGDVSSLGLVGTSTGLSNVLQSPAASPTATMFSSITQAYINNSPTLAALPNLVQAGGSGGSAPSTATTGGSGASCSYGSGGGGGSRHGTTTTGQGGNGGVGYVLIICY